MPVFINSSVKNDGNWTVTAAIYDLSVTSYTHNFKSSNLLGCYTAYSGS
jgi:hypothetical protein